MAASLFDLLEGRSILKQVKTALLRRLADNPRGFEQVPQHTPDMKEETLSDKYGSGGPRLNNGVVHDYIKHRKSSAGETIVKGMPQRRVPNEQLTSKVGKAINAPVGEVKKNAENEIEMPKVQGLNGNDPNFYSRSSSDPLEVTNHHLLRGGKQLGLLDYLTGNSDRGLGHNYMIPTDENGDPKKEVRGIDHEFTFNDLEPSKHGYGPFSNYWIGRGQSQHGLTKEELKKVRPALEALRPDFEENEYLGSDSGAEHHAAMMKKLDDLIKRAKPIDPTTGYPKGFETGYMQPESQDEEEDARRAQQNNAAPMPAPLIPPMAPDNDWASRILKRRDNKPAPEPEPEPEEESLTPRRQRRQDALDRIVNPDVIDDIRQKNRRRRGRRFLAIDYVEHMGPYEPPKPNNENNPLEQHIRQHPEHQLLGDFLDRPTNNPGQTGNKWHDAQEHHDATHQYWQEFADDENRPNEYHTHGHGTVPFMPKKPHLSIREAPIRNHPYRAPIQRPHSEHKPQENVGCPKCGGDTKWRSMPYEGYNCPSCNIDWGSEIASLGTKRSKIRGIFRKNASKKGYKVAMETYSALILASGVDHHDGIMVAIYPPKEVAEQLLLPDGEDLEELHITLAYLGDVGDYGVPAEQIMKELDLALQDLKITTVTIEVDGTHTFPPKDGKFPLVAGVVCTPKLQNLRDQVVDLCNTTTAQVDTTFPEYKPHITLKYFDENEPEPNVNINHFSFPATKITVVVAGQRHEIDIDDLW